MFRRWAGPDGHTAPRLMANNSAATQQMRGDCSMLVVLDAGGGEFFALGYNPNGKGWDWDPCFELGGYPTGVVRMTNHDTRIGATPGSAVKSVDYFLARYTEATKTLTVRNASGKDASGTNPAMPAVTKTFNAIWLGGTFEGPYFGQIKFHQIVLWPRVLTDAEASAVIASAARKFPR
jgi:hypothetical protein